MTERQRRMFEAMTFALVVALAAMLALAVKRVAIGRTVFVAREDAGEVLEAARVTDGDNANG